MTTMLIQNEEQHKRYLKEVEDLIDLDPAIDTPEGERLSLLALAIEEYESKRFFFRTPTPIEAIRFRMEEQGLKQADLVPYIGSKSKVSEVLAGKREFTKSMIAHLNHNLGIPLEVFFPKPEQSSNKLNTDNIDWSKFPIKEMIKRKWSTLKSKTKIDPKEIMAEFFKPIDGLTSQGVMWRRSFHNRVADNSNEYDLQAWSARVMILAEQMKIGEFNKNLLTMDYLRDVAKLSVFEQGPLLAKEKLANIGIKLVFQKHLPKTKVDGCCFLDKKGHPVIGMTIRHDRTDNFWFTLLHELAHAYKHLINKDDFFIDDLESDSHGAVKEKEADDIACDSFIPKSIWKENDIRKSPTKKSILDLSKKLSIHPAVIAGRIRFEANDYKKFADLIGQGQVVKMLKEYINE